LEQVLRVGLIGAGRIASAHANGIRRVPGLKLVGAARRDERKCREFAERYGCRAYRNWKDMLNDGLDIAVVALPHYLHFEAAMAAIEKGCHVMLEKPAAMNLDQCRAISAAAKRADRKVMVADIAYHLPGVVKAREIVSSGKMGRFIMGSIINYRFYFTEDRPAWFLEKEKAGGGMLFNLGVHRMAVVRSVVPGEEILVKASVGFFRRGCEVEGNGMIFIGYPDGTAVVLEECGYLGVPEGLNGGMHFTFENGILGDVAGNLWISDRKGNVERPNLLSPPGGPYQPLYEEMLSAIKEDREPWPGIVQGAKDVRVILAAYESARTGQQVELRGPEWEV